MKKIVDLRIGDVIWVRNIDKTQNINNSFIKHIVLEFKKGDNSDKDYMIARELNTNKQIHINISEFKLSWFINNPEKWDSTKG